MRVRNSGVSKLVFLFVAIVVALVTVMVMSGYYPPGNENLSGTIAPAERYQSDQISESDVVLGDESVAKIMQTDEFEQLVNGQPASAQGVDAASDSARMKGSDAARMKGSDAAVLKGADAATMMKGADAATIMKGADAATIMKGTDAATMMKGADAAKATENAKNNQ
jgi:hypothetical protein